MTAPILANRKPLLSREGSLAVCVPTYRRPQLLKLLLDDLARQTLRPELLIVVDGDPVSGEARHVAYSSRLPCRVAYLPSNHANLPYQRYLGWRAAAGCRWLVYLDDDLRITQTECIERLVQPLQWRNRRVAGVTARIVFPRKEQNAPSLPGCACDRRGRASWLVRWFGAGGRTPAGGLTPAGNRKRPICNGDDYAAVNWLHGGVMAFPHEVLDANCFSEDVFALAETGCGLGEDTILSRKAGERGELLFAFCAGVEHPHADTPKAYAVGNFQLAYATALSRRLINDNYRASERPTLADRLSLLRSYAGNTLLHWSRAIGSLERRRLDHALGYSLGALRGVLQEPAAHRIAPGIDWRLDAEEALRLVEERKPATCPQP